MIQRFANPSWAKGGWSSNGEKLAVVKPVPDKMLAVRPKLETTTEASLVSRGITVMADLSSGPPSSEHRQILFGPHEMQDYSKRYLNGKVVANMSRDDIRFFILNYLPPFAVASDQAAEGYGEEESKYIVYDHTSQRDWMDEALAEKVNNTNPKGLFIAGYDNKLSGASNIFAPGVDCMAYASTLNSKNDARSNLAFYTRSISNAARANFQSYYGGGIAEPMSRRHEYIRSYAMSRLALASDSSLPPIDFLWPSWETPSANPAEAAWIPAYAWVHPRSDGTLYKNNESWSGVNAITIGILHSFILGGGTICWERPDWFSEDILDLMFQLFYGSQPDDWWVGINGAPRPNKRDGHRQFIDRPMSIFDGVYKGGLYAGEINNRVGFNFQYVEFRTTRNGVTSAWKTPLTNNKATVLQSGKNFEGLAHGIEDGNNIGGVFSDPSAPVTGQLVDMRYPSGKIVSFDHYGAEPVVFAGDLVGSSITLNRKDAFRIQ